MNNREFFLKTRGTDIVSGEDQVLLTGVNLGGWLMMEGYILHSPNVAQQAFKNDFAGKLGAGALQEFEKAFHDHFITAQDLKRIAAMGFNCVRVPFHYRIVEKALDHDDETGLGYLDKVIGWAKDNRLRVILDLHAAPGCQNHDWHSDSLGQADLWTHPEHQRSACRIWEFLARRYREEKTVAGYDVLNEAVTPDMAVLNAFYRQVIRAIRSVDKNHILFIEGNNWARDYDGLEEWDDDNWALSIHFYDPMDFTFNFVPHLTYPHTTHYDRGAMENFLGKYRTEARRRRVPVYVGEFGVNYRDGLFGEDRCLADTLECFRANGFHWTYWTYKAVKNATFPDGVFSYYPNPDWVRRHGPAYGWENYAACWPRQQREMAASWRTEQFRENTRVSDVLKQAARSTHDQQRSKS